VEAALEAETDGDAVARVRTDAEERDNAAVPPSGYVRSARRDLARKAKMLRKVPLVFAKPERESSSGSSR